MTQFPVFSSLVFSLTDASSTKKYLSLSHNLLPTPENTTITPKGGAHQDEGPEACQGPQGVLEDLEEGRQGRRGRRGLRRGVAPDFFVDFFVPPPKNLPPSCFRSSLKINKQKLSINKHLRVPLERSRRVPLQASSGHAKEKIKKRGREEKQRGGVGVVLFSFCSKYCRRRSRIFSPSCFLSLHRGLSGRAAQFPRAPKHRLTPPAPLRTPI